MQLPGCRDAVAANDVTRGILNNRPSPGRRKPMRKPALFVLSVSLLALVVTVHAQEQTHYTNYYVFNGATLQVVNDFSFYRTDQQWQVWLYQEGVHIPRYTAGLQHSRWVLIQGGSADSVKGQVKTAQNCEHGY